MVWASPRFALGRPACGIKPLALEAADVAHAVGAAVILRGVDLELKRGEPLTLTPTLTLTLTLAP